MWQPDFLPGLQASVDYYRIALKGAIVARGLQQVEDLCFAGYNTFCQQNELSPPMASTKVYPIMADLAQRALQAVASEIFNFAALTTDGVDLEAAYRSTFRTMTSLAPSAAFVGRPHQQVYRGLWHSGTKQNVEITGPLGGGDNSNSYNSNSTC